MLQPFLGYLLVHHYAWNSEPERIRSYVKAFLCDEVSCLVSRDATLDGYRVGLTGNSPLAHSSLRVFLAALRDFYAVMQEAGLYAFANPLCSEMLLRWKRERIRHHANGGAPDHAGIRKETRSETNMLPTAFFRLRRGKVWQPSITLTSEQIQQRMRTCIDWMARHATNLRDKVIFLLLRYTGARLSEILSLTAGGYRKAKDPYQAYVKNKGSHGREEKVIRMTPAIEAALVRYVRTERVKYDPLGRKRLEELDDTDPLFLTRRHTAYGREAFYHHWHKLYATLPSHLIGSSDEARAEPLAFTVHDIRHLRVTEWLTRIKQECVGNVQKERLLRRGIQRWMGWKSEKTIECYDHSFTEREEEETFAAFQREVEQELTASRLSSKQTKKRQTKELRQPSLQSAAVSQAIADLDFWKDEL
jgi:integrase